MSKTEPQYFDAPHGTRIGFFKTPGKTPTVVFMGGLMSDMSGSKATFLEGFCREKGQAYLRFDYGGHGVSSGRFEDGTIGAWHRDALAAIDNLTEGPLLLVGSSMGGWQVLLAALARKERVKGLIGLAAAPDFTKTLLLDKMDQRHRTELKERGRVLVPSDYEEPYIFTRTLLEEGNDHLLLEKPIDLDMPICLIHGMQDADVPFQVSLDILDALKGKDAELMLVKEGLHSLSGEADLKRLGNVLENLLKKVSRNA